MENQSRDFFFLLISSDKFLNSLCIGNLAFRVPGLKLNRDHSKCLETHYWLDFFSEVDFSLPIKLLASVSFPFLVSYVVLHFFDKEDESNYTKDCPGLCHTTNNCSGLRRKSLTLDQRDFLQYLETRTSFCLILQVQIEV